MNSSIEIVAQVVSELNKTSESSDTKEKGMQHTKAYKREFLKKKWCGGEGEKVIRGQYARCIDRQLISEEDGFVWLSRGDLKAETGSKIVAAQDRALQTKYYVTRVLKTETANAGCFANMTEQ